jgi:hypothetical protein
MLSQVIEWAKLVVHQWAALAGGLLMSVVALVCAMKGRNVPKFLAWCLAVLFLLSAFFLTWLDQREQKNKALAETDNLKQVADYQQKRIDRLTEILHSKPTDAGISNSGIMVQSGAQIGTAIQNLSVDGKSLEPSLEGRWLEYKTPRKGKFYSVATINLKTKLPVRNLFFQVKSKSIESAELSPVGLSGSLSGLTALRPDDGIWFTNLPGAAGEYRLLVQCGAPDDIEITWRTE